MADFKISDLPDAGGPLDTDQLEVARAGSSLSMLWSSIKTAVLALMPGAASPTSAVGTAAVNGAASTFMRSDAAPAINQAMVPTWTALHTFKKSIAASTVEYLVTLANLTTATNGNPRHSPAQLFTGSSYKAGAKVQNWRCYVKAYSSALGSTATGMSDFVWEYQLGSGAWTEAFRFTNNSTHDNTGIPELNVTGDLTTTGKVNAGGGFVGNFNPLTFVGQYLSNLLFVYFDDQLTSGTRQLFIKMPDSDVSIQLDGDVRISTAPIAVASLPVSPADGTRNMVNDALAPVFGSAVAGGGAVTVPVYFGNGSWKVG